MLNAKTLLAGTLAVAALGFVAIPEANAFGIRPRPQPNTAPRADAESNAVGVGVGVGKANADADSESNALAISGGGDADADSTSIAVGKGGDAEGGSALSIAGGGDASNDVDVTTGNTAKSLFGDAVGGDQVNVTDGDVTNELSNDSASLSFAGVNDSGNSENTNTLLGFQDTTVLNKDLVDLTNVNLQGQYQGIDAFNPQLGPSRGYQYGDNSFFSPEATSTVNLTTTLENYSPNTATSVSNSNQSVNFYNSTDVRR